MKKNTTTQTYESAYNELQQIVSALQNDAISIDDLSEKVKRASELVAFCQDKLRNTELKVSNSAS
jgi:exodeoxyribonuclease VII small subunit